MTAIIPICDNCDEDAVYCINEPVASPVFYCRLCLPGFLQMRANAGHFPLQPVNHEQDHQQPEEE